MRCGIEVIDKGNHTVVLVLSGEIDMDNAAQLRQAILDRNEAGDKIIVLDFDALTFIDSSGIGTLVSTLKALKISGAELRIARLKGPVAKVITITGVDKILPPYDSLDAALKN